MFGMTKQQQLQAYVRPYGKIIYANIQRSLQHRHVSNMSNYYYYYALCRMWLSHRSEKKKWFSPMLHWQQTAIILWLRLISYFGVKYTTRANPNNIIIFEYFRSPQRMTLLIHSDSDLFLFFFHFNVTRTNAIRKLERQNCLCNSIL